MQYDDILRRIGELGTYQKRVFFVICITLISNGFHSFLSVFLTGTPDHRCQIPGYNNDTYVIQNAYHKYLINLTIPISSDEEYIYSQCEIYNVSLLNNNTFDDPVRIPCHSWVYDKSVYLSTFTEKVDLVCENKLKPSYSEMVYFAGLLVGSVGFGFLSDGIGRKKTYFMAMVSMIGASMGLPWSTSFSVFCILRFIIGASDIGIFITGFVIGMEFVGPTKRGSIGVGAFYFQAVGTLMLAGIAYAIRDWFYIQIVCSIPAIFYLSFWWFIPESPRWLISKKKYTEAFVIIKKAAKVNKVDIPKNLFDIETIEERNNQGIQQLFTSRILLVRTLIIFFNWMILMMVFYGLIFNNKNLYGDFYLNFFLQGVMQFASCPICHFLMNRTGRRPLYCTALILGGLCCISTCFTVYFSDKRYQFVAVILVMLGKIGIVIGTNTIHIWSSELFPTVVRNAGIGLSSTCSRFSALLAPFIADLSKLIPGAFGRMLPLAIFGGSSILAGLLALTLPETANMDLPESIKDGELFGTMEKLKSEDDNKKIEVSLTTRL